MCGISGFIDTSKSSSDDELRGIVTRMAASIAHRGPDDHGVWVDPANGVALGHRRLSIIDRSSEGHQPMLSANRRFVVVFNGEIYNFGALRRALESAGHRFRGHSDTEVLLAGICEWGLELTLKKSVGMFAIALWDQKCRSLSLARDRIGEKPLYYGWQGRVFMFGSELKPLRCHPQWRAEIDRNAVALLMQHGYIPAPNSIYSNIRKLSPGEILTLSCEDLRPLQWPAPHAYWSLRECAEEGVANPFTGSDLEAVEALEESLRESIRLQMVADVPVGAFLSGGIDSSTVVALMQAENSRPVKTFSVGFYEQSYNEARHAKAVAEHLGTDHTELYVTADQTMAVIPSLSTIYDEPFADSSQIPTYLLAQLTRRHVTVSLSGDGGDELFFGYLRYETRLKMWQSLARIPAVVRTGLAPVVSSAPPSLMNFLLGLYGRSSGGLANRRPTRSQWQSFARTLEDDRGEAFYRTSIFHWLEASDLVRGSQEPLTPVTDRSRSANLSEFCQQMLYVDTVDYLPDDILVKVDRAAMAVSLETRIPMLDHRVVELAWRMPLRLKRREGQGKWLLRQVLDRYVPKQLIERPKMGFGVPLDTWLRGPLRDWAESLLSESRLKGEGYFDVKLVRQKWAEHLSAQYDHGSLLWDALMFQSWLENSRTPAATGTFGAIAV